MRGSTTGRPIMALLDLLGRRGTLRVLWELSQLDAPITFRELQARCGDMSSSVLNTRVRELRDAGLVAPGGYELADLGRELVDEFAPLQQFSERWAAAATRAARRRG